MTNRTFILILAITMLIGHHVSAQQYQVGPEAMTAEIAPIQAPFEMPQLQRPQIADRQATVAMSASKMNTQAIQQAIDKMAQQGGGTVVIPAGNWQTDGNRSPQRLTFRGAPSRPRKKPMPTTSLSHERKAANPK